jgi:hypothetical protein
VFHPDAERSEIIGKGWQDGAQRQTAGVVDDKVNSFFLNIYLNDNYQCDL